MAAPYNDLLSKLEAAAKSVVDALGLTGVTVNTGLDEDTLTLPYVVCSATDSREEVIDTGLERVRLQIIVASDADAHGLTAHRQRVATVYDAFRDDAIETTLSAAVSDFDVTFIRMEGQTASVDGRKLRNVLELDAVCCGLDLA